MCTKFSYVKNDSKIALVNSKFFVETYNYDIKNRIGIKCNNFINQLNSEKIINFNFKSPGRKFFSSYEWLFEVEKQLVTNKSFNYNEKVFLKQVLKIDQSFSGIIIVNDQLHIFVYKGHVSSAINTENFFIDDHAIQSIDNVHSIEFKSDDSYLPLIVASIISTGISRTDHTEISISELTQMMDKISDTDFNGYIELICNESIFSIIYKNGENIFSIMEKDKSSILINDHALQKIILESNEQVIINVYNSRLNIINYSLDEILLQTKIIISKLSLDCGCLNNVVRLGNEHLHNKLKNSIIKNISIKKILPIPEKITIFNGELSIPNLLNNTESYKFIEWVLFKLFFQIKENGTMSDFENLYYSIPNITKISFTESDNGEMRILFKKDSCLLFIAQIGNSSTKSFDEFITDINSFKNTIGKESLLSALYLSDNDFNPQTVSKYKELTKVPSFKILNRKQKGYVRLSANLGYTLFLVSKKQNDFNLSQPAF